MAHGFTLSWQHGAVWKVASRLQEHGGVVSFDFRGHGRSGGLSTMGDREIKDLDVAVRYARELGYRRIAAVGFSMGASVVMRYAGLVGGLDAAVSVSGPGHWYYRGTKPMRRVHFAVERRVGRAITRTWLKTRVSPAGWNPVPVPPDEAAAMISPTPLLDRARRPGPVLPASTTASGCTDAAQRAQGVLGGTGVRARGVRRRPARCWTGSRGGSGSTR